jgi:exonuclease III
MMRIASINLNKRLGNPKAHQRVEAWLLNNKIDLLLVQEPWNRGRIDAIPFRFWDDLGGSDGIRTWIRRKWKSPKVRNLRENWQEIQLDYMIVHNVYLSAYDSNERCKFLIDLKKYISSDSDRPILIVGDFNLAPTPRDGMVDNQISTFTQPQERIDFESLLSNVKLVDVTGSNFSNAEHVQYTIERRFKSSISRFRCDLALLTDYMVSMVKARYDHEVRTGMSSFTDHSALIIDASVTLPVTENQSLDLFENMMDEDGTEVKPLWSYSPHNTAMARSEPSAVAKAIAASELVNGKRPKILDFGCGRGEDLRFYQGLGIEADGWDPYEPFGFSKRPTGQYDIVTCTFVLNVLPNPYERVRTLRDSLSFTRPGGSLVIATRSPEAIESEATRKGWKKHNDGYWSDERKGQFQKGISLDEIKLYLKHIGLEIHPYTFKLTQIGGSVLAVVSPT